MDLHEVTSKEKDTYNNLVTHIIQSWQWGEFRKKLGLPVLRYGIKKNSRLTGAFQLTLHKIPFTPYFVGYLPKGPFPGKELAFMLSKIAKECKVAFIKAEPNIESQQMADGRWQIDQAFKPSKKPLFTKYNFVLDLTKPEEDLLSNMHPKTRYNINLAKKKGVAVEERDDKKAFEVYLKLYFETTKRQGYFGHNIKYHQLVWEILRDAKMARLLLAFYKKTPVVAWMLLNFKDTLYYPYGGSSFLYKEAMASNLVAWETIRLGKKMGLKKFDMWGALGPDAAPSDRWFGFHRFKQGYGGRLVEYLGSFDIVFNKPLYSIFTRIDKSTKLKVSLLKLLKLFR